jgi:hypothetical protein
MVNFKKREINFSSLTSLLLSTPPPPPVPTILSPLVARLQTHSTKHTHTHTRIAKRRPSGSSAKTPGGPPQPVTAYADRKVAKPTVSPYLTGFILIMLSGGAILQVLKLFGLGTEDMDDYY